MKACHLQMPCRSHRLIGSHIQRSRHHARNSGCGGTFTGACTKAASEQRSSRDGVATYSSAPHWLLLLSSLCGLRRTLKIRESVSAQGAKHVSALMEQPDKSFTFCILSYKGHRSTRNTNADRVLDPHEILGVEAVIQTNIRANAHRAALQGRLSSIPSCDRSPDEVKFTFARKNVKQMQLKRGLEVTLSYNTRIQRVPVDNAHSTQHVLKRERQSAEVIEGQKNRR